MLWPEFNPDQLVITEGSKPEGQCHPSPLKLKSQMSGDCSLLTTPHSEDRAHCEEMAVLPPRNLETGMWGGQ
ncbi:hypothetical protein ACRRTK_000443 [Alexandromys fortis]